jgi:hypothetical protein
MENFFSSLKTEPTARKVYRSQDEAKADVFDYIERFYNPKRRDSTIGYTSPHGVLLPNVRDGQSKADLKPGMFDVRASLNSGH